MATNLGDAIQNALVDAARNFAFPTISYDSTTHHRTTGTDTVPPRSFEAWDGSSAWDDALIQRRGGRPLDRGPWTWFLLIKFSRGVSTEEFERSLEDNPPRVLRSASPFNRQVDIFLREANYERPPRGQSSSGTTATYRFEAIQTPQ